MKFNIASLSVISLNLSKDFVIWVKISYIKPPKRQYLLYFLFFQILIFVYGPLHPLEFQIYTPLFLYLFFLQQSYWVRAQYLYPTKPSSSFDIRLLWLFPHHQTEHSSTILVRKRNKFEGVLGAYWCMMHCNDFLLNLPWP